MNPPEQYGLVVNYTDGTHEHFKFPPQVEKAKMGTTVEKLLSSGVLCLQLEDRILVIPTANIRSAELFPIPERLPDVVLRNVQRISLGR